MFGWDFLLMLSRDSEHGMWSRFMFELLIWLQEATLARWTQSSGPLCLWQCFIVTWQKSDGVSYLSLNLIEYMCCWLYLKMREEINFPPSMNLWDAKIRGKIPISRLGLYPLCFIRVKFEIHIPGYVAWEEIYFWGELCIWQCFIIARGAQITRPHLLPIAKCHTMWEMWKAEWRWCTVW